MVLDFGIIGQRDNLQTADYRSAGSHQAENVNFEDVTTSGVWEEIHTVTEGKTYYVSAVIMGANTAGSWMEIGIGAAASEVTIFKVRVKDLVPFQIPLPTPMKFSSGTRISIRTDTEDDTATTFIGWEE